MAETQREPVPRNDAGELDTACAFLGFARRCVLKKADGLDDEQLRRVLVDSGTSILGLVQHLTVGERYKFGLHVAGQGSFEDSDFDLVVPAGSSAEQVLAGYRAAIADSDAIIAAVGDPESLSAMPVDGKKKSLRWVIAHMTGETTRHAGHADILREQIDGTSGR